MKWKDVNELCAKTVQDVQDGWRVSKQFRVYVTNDGFFGLWVVRCTSSIHQRIMEPHFFYIETKMWFLNIFQCLKVGILFGSANLDKIPQFQLKSGGKVPPSMLYFIPSHTYCQCTVQFTCTCSDCSALIHWH